MYLIHSIARDLDRYHLFTKLESAQKKWDDWKEHGICIVSLRPSIDSEQVFEHQFGKHNSMVWE